MISQFIVLALPFLSISDFDLKETKYAQPIQVKMLQKHCFNENSENWTECYYFYFYDTAYSYCFRTCSTKKTTTLHQKSSGADIYSLIKIDASI